MTFLSAITCAFGRCRPARESVRWDREAYAHIGECRDCGKPIRRLAHRKWVKVG